MNHDTKLLQDLVDEYARSIGMESLSLDEDGQCSLLIDDKFAVTLEAHPERGTLVIFSEIGPLPIDREDDFCRKILEANYFWQHTGGLGTLSLAPKKDLNVPQIVVFISQLTLQSLDQGRFQNQLSDFVDTAEAWIDYLRDFGQDEGNVPPFPNTDFDGSMIRV